MPGRRGDLCTPLNVLVGACKIKNVAVMVGPRAVWEENICFSRRVILTRAETNGPPTPATIFIGFACRRAPGGRVGASAARRNSHAGQACASTLVDATQRGPPIHGRSYGFNTSAGMHCRSNLPHAMCYATALTLIVCTASTACVCLYDTSFQNHTTAK